MAVGRDEFDATLFLLDALGFLLASAGLTIVYHRDLLAVGGVGSGLM